MAAALPMTREQKSIRKQKRFLLYASMIIRKMVDLASEKGSSARSSVLVDEVLHSIFFLGALSNPKSTPESIVGDEKMLEELKELYPQPFLFFSLQLPRRSPFSCVLDMIVDLKGQNNENIIITELQGLIQTLKTNEIESLMPQTPTGQPVLREDGGTPLVSSTICVSQPDTTPKSVRYYGVSMSTSGTVPGQIVVAASCLSKWDSYVADAVMTYYSKEKKKQKKTYFDGTIKLPKQARCQAFSLSDGAKMAPCRSCGNMFGLTTNETKEWPYGNCAEAESLSNLLENEKEMRKQVQQPSDTCIPANRQEAVKHVEEPLGEYLRMQMFSKNSKKVINFYTPQGN